MSLRPALINRGTCPLSKDTDTDAVVDLAHARVRLNSRAHKSASDSLVRELEAVRGLIDQGLTIEARSRCCDSGKGLPTLRLAQRAGIALSLEMQGHPRVAQAVAMYDPRLGPSSIRPGPRMRTQTRCLQLAATTPSDHVTMRCSAILPRKAQRQRWGEVSPR